MTVVKNMTKPPVNFQGIPLDKCIHSAELGLHVFIHEAYNKAWRKRQKEALFFPKKDDHLVCQYCFLCPCSVRMFESKLECDACDLLDLICMNEEEHREIKYKVRQMFE